MSNKWEVTIRGYKCKRLRKEVYGGTFQHRPGVTEYLCTIKSYPLGGFSCGPVLRNPPSKAGDAGSIPDLGTKIPHATGQLSPRPAIREAQKLQWPPGSTRTKTRTENTEAGRGNQQVCGQGLLRARLADTSEYWFQITHSKNHVKITKEARYIKI